jgi:hypothetical protein
MITILVQICKLIVLNGAIGNNYRDRRRHCRIPPAPFVVNTRSAAALPKTENVMADNAAVRCPASYFPSIEKKYGQPVQHWLSLLTARDGGKHMELVAWLKSEHGMGHGHANALVAHHLAAKGR